MRPRAHNLTVRPFATALAFLLFASTIVALTDTGLTRDALKHLVPGWLLLGLSLAYGVGGLGILLGMWLDRENWEAAGCVLVLSGLMVRIIALLYILGWSPGTMSATFFYLVFGWACLERLRQILRGDHVVRVPREVKHRFKGDQNAGSE